MSNNLWNEMEESKNNFHQNHELRMTELNNAISRLDAIREVATASFENFQHQVIQQDQTFAEISKQQDDISRQLDELLASF